MSNIDGRLSNLRGEVESSNELVMPDQINPYSLDALIAADIEPGGKIYCYYADAGRIALRYLCQNISEVYLNNQNEMEIMGNRISMMATNLRLADLGIVPHKDNSWSPAVSFAGPEDINKAQFTSAWDELLATRS